jgi:hypothetical protein
MPSDDSSINGVDVVGVEAFKLPPDKVAGLAIQRWPFASRTMKQAAVSSTDHGGGKRRRFQMN